MLRYKEIKQQIDTIIASMRPAEALPSREALCKSLDTTRSTLDKAIKELVAEGKLVTRGGSGTYVAGDVSGQPNEIKSIGVLLPNNTHLSYRMLISGIEEFMHTKDVNVILCNTDNDIDKQNQYLSRLIQSKVIGLIVVPALYFDITKNYVLYSRLMQHRFPVVFCFRGIDGLTNAPLVCYNNFYGGYIATKHLITQGYRHIAYISEKTLRTSLDRFQGYMAALLEAGLEINRSMVILEPESRGYEEMTRILHSGAEVDAVFCQADCLAPHVYRAIRDAGLRVSDDIGVIGFDNSDCCVTETPAVTSLGNCDAEIGMKAAQILWKAIENEEEKTFPYFLFSPDIIVRESCLGPKKKT